MDSTSVEEHVVCIGAATLDTIAVVPHHLAPDERLEAAEMTVAGGGPAATAAVTLARLGVRVFFAGRVGDDDAGLAIREGLEREGVDVSELAVFGGARSATSAVLVEAASGARSIAAFPGTLPAVALSARGAGLCRRAAWVHVDHAGYAAGATVRPHRLSVDAGNPIPGLRLQGVSLFAPTEAALERIYPGLELRDAVARVIAAGVECVVVTRGAHGSVAATRDGAFVTAGAFAAEVLSTLGAGDVFHGALLAALLGGSGLDEALGRANAAAALSCRALDGRSAIPTAAELQAALSATR